MQAGNLRLAAAPTGHMQSCRMGALHSAAAPGVEGGMTSRRRKLQQMIDQAARNAVALGHRLRGVDVEEDWTAAVATCGRCRLLAAIDLTESPYLFGRALERKCQ